jgi:hypothetical protein
MASGYRFLKVEDFFGSGDAHYSNKERLEEFVSEQYHVDYNDKEKKSLKDSTVEIHVKSNLGNEYVVSIVFLAYNIFRVYACSNALSLYLI